jgi:hypothetical protein
MPSVILPNDIMPSVILPNAFILTAVVPAINPPLSELLHGVLISLSVRRLEPGLHVGREALVQTFVVVKKVLSLLIKPTTNIVLEQKLQNCLTL